MSTMTKILGKIQAIHPDASSYNFSSEGKLIVTMSRLASIRDVYLDKQYMLMSVEPGVSQDHRGDLFCTFWPVTRSQG